ncbi:hypothetical protein [Risungbinella massiliensis]|nr:hypothetical protein [Risungbinella massiliensis]
MSGYYGGFLGGGSWIFIAVIAIVFVLCFLGFGLFGFGGGYDYGGYDC